MWRSGARLLWDLHGEDGALRSVTKWEVQYPSCLQPERATYIWHGYPFPAGANCRHKSNMGSKDMSGVHFSLSSVDCCLRNFWIHKQNPHTSCKPHSVHSVFSRWATQLQQSLASTLRCSSCPRKSCGCLTDQWASEKEAIQLSLKVYKYCHLMDIGKHYTQSTFKFSLLSRL